MMFICKIIFFLIISLISQLIFTEYALAWGPAIHTVIACRILEEASQVFPVIGGIIRSFPLEYMYGSLAADFFIGKGTKRKNGHSHNWEAGFRFLAKAKDDRERSYAFGFFSHLAADVVAHNYFIPNLIHQASTWKRMGHLYWEARADFFVGPLYMQIARDVLNMEQLGCDNLLKSAVGKSRNGLKARRCLFTQTVKISNYLSCYQPMTLINRGSRYKISPEYMTSMIGLSYRLVKDFLTHPGSSPCVSYDPIGSRNLRLASRNAVLSKLFNSPRPIYQFNVDQELIEI